MNLKPLVFFSNSLLSLPTRSCPGRQCCLSSKSQWSSFSPLTNGSHLLPDVSPGSYAMSDRGRRTVPTLPTLCSLSR